MLTLPFVPLLAAALTATDTLGIPTLLLANELRVSPADEAKVARIQSLRVQCRDVLARAGALREHLARVLQEMETNAQDTQVGHLASVLCELVRARRAAAEVTARCAGRAVVAPVPVVGGSDAGAGGSTGCVVAESASVGVPRGFCIVVKTVKKVAEKLGLDADGMPLTEGALATVDDEELATLEARVDEWR